MIPAKSNTTTATIDSSGDATAYLPRIGYACIQAVHLEKTGTNSCDVTLITNDGYDVLLGAGQNITADLDVSVNSFPCNEENTDGTNEHSLKMVVDNGTTNETVIATVYYWK